MDMGEMNLGYQERRMAIRQDHSIESEAETSNTRDANGGLLSSRP